jgi:thiosulfate/3-mercaptopyruvate sulfurtransferase
MSQPAALITTEQLAAILGDPNLRLYDCTTYNEPVPPGSDVPYRAVPGDKTFEAGHIPGADFLDLQGEFSDTSSRQFFMMPDVAQLETAFGRHGLDASKTIVLYSIGTMMWSTRFWWMLRSLGVDAQVLDGGFDKWKEEGRAVATGAPKGYPATTFKAAPREGLFVDKNVVKARIRDPATVIVNALGPQFHRGLEPSRYGRPGRVPGSVNVSAATLVNADKTLTTLADAEAKFAAAGVTRDKNVICYCGGGISATIDLFLLTQLGYDKLTLYDASMGEWARDPALPIETDCARAGLGLQGVRAGKEIREPFPQACIQCPEPVETRDPPCQGTQPACPPASGHRKPS